MKISEILNEDKGVTIDGKQVDVESIEMEDVHTGDYPDFVDAFVGTAQFVDGTELSEEQCDQLRDKYPDLIHELAHDNLH